MFFSTAEHIAAEASKVKFWIFDPSAKEWHSPEDFLEKFGRIKAGLQQYLDQIEVRDPFEGINASFQRMLDHKSNKMWISPQTCQLYRTIHHWLCTHLL